MCRLYLGRETLYHYSPLLHLPTIIREGLSQGDIANPYSNNHQTAVSLTSQSDPESLFCWGSLNSLPEKMAVRYVCNIPNTDKNLEPTRDTWKRLRFPSHAAKSLDPFGQSKWWYYYHGVIPPSQFTIELRGRQGYVQLPSTELTRISEEVAILRDKFVFTVPPDQPWASYVKLKDPMDKAPLWVLDEVFPADRFLAT